MTSKRLFQILIVFFIFATAVPANASYRSQLRKVTDRGRVYSLHDFDARLVWHASFFSDDFRREYEEKHIDIHHLDQEDADRFIAEQDYRQKEGWDFFIGFYAKADYKRFMTGKDSFWKLYLITEKGEKIKPSSFEMIPVSPYERIMFPYLNRWSKAYRITFPKVELGKKFELFLHSVVGESTLKFKNAGK